MSIWLLLPLPIMSAAVAVTALQRRDPATGALALLPLAATGILTVTSGPVRTGMEGLLGPTGIGLLVEGGLTFWLLHEVREGDWARWRWGRPRFQFDRQLHLEIERYNAALNAKPSEPAGPEQQEQWARNVMQQGELVLARIRDIRAPDHDWAELRDDYIDLIARQIEAVKSPPTASESLALADRNRRITTRALELRGAYSRKPPTRRPRARHG